jgi:hypothetical protein
MQMQSELPDGDRAPGMTPAALREAAEKYLAAAKEWRRMAPDAITPAAFAELSITVVESFENAASLLTRLAERIEGE